MKPLSVRDIAAAIGGELVVPAQQAGQGGDALVTAVSTDTRNLPDGCLFVALRGDNFDGHDFASVAVEGGAACLMLDSMPDEDFVFSVPVVLVKAMWYRRQLDIKVIAITGSNGKTSTKDFTASVLSGQFKVNATKGNLNNHIGLPLSVLATEETDQVCIWEMGMNHAGEIAPLCEIVRPDIGIITNIGTAHIEHLGTREGIAEEKSTLARALPEKGTLIVPATCDFVEYLIARTSAGVVVAGNGRGTVRAEDFRITDTGSSFTLCIDGQPEAEVNLAVSGRHMVNNALLAAAAGYKLGMDTAAIAAGLNAAQLTSGRLRRYDSNGVTVIDDSYNANPDSVAAAIETMADMPAPAGARKIIVLGMMAELGVHADTEHRRIGKLAAERNLCVVSVGVAAEKIYEGASEVDGGAQHFDAGENAADWLADHGRKGDIVLFKGSRMAGMEKVMQRAFSNNQS